MSPTIFPSPNPQFYNSPYAATFDSKYFSKLNETEWTDGIPVELDDPTNKNYMDLLEKYDDAIFKRAED